MENFIEIFKKQGKEFRISQINKNKRKFKPKCLNFIIIFNKNNNKQ